MKMDIEALRKLAGAANETQDDDALIACREAEDQAFVAASREAIPALCDEIERLTRQRDDTVEAVVMIGRRVTELVRERDEARAVATKLSSAYDALHVGYTTEERQHVLETIARWEAEKAGAT